MNKLIQALRTYFHRRALRVEANRLREDAWYWEKKAQRAQPVGYRSAAECGLTAWELGRKADALDALAEQAA